MSRSRQPAGLGEIVIATEVITNRPAPRQARTIILLLAASVALMMTGFGIIMPVFARRLEELGGGVEALGLMTVAFAVAQLVASPLMGSAADRLGRRPPVLLALASFAIANVGFLLAPSTEIFILVRFLEGALTAGLFPAAMGVVADIVPEHQRARWIGIVMGGYGAGFVFGPAIGGILYDGWGYAAPFIVSASLAVLALLAAFIVVPETRPAAARYREKLRRRRFPLTRAGRKESLWEALPRPLLVFGTLLTIDFIGSFAFAFVEPQMVFYLYDDLGWSTVRFGVVVGAYGLAMVLGQTLLGQASDRVGRKPIIILGIMLNSMLYATLAFIRSYALVMVTSAIAGLGNALTAPALSAYYLDITAHEHRARVVGIKESSLALGGIAGPLLVVGAARFMTAQAIFVTAGLLVLSSAVLGLILLREPQRNSEQREDLAWEVAENRSLAAQASLRGIVMNARAARRRFLYAG